MSLWPELATGEFQMRFVDVAGVRTRCLQAGEGAPGAPPLVLLHGSGGHLEAYVRNLLPAARDHRVYAIDMLGHGFTAHPDRPYEIPDYVAHLIGFLDAMGIERAHISGESLGGWVAAWLASQHPQRVAKLLLNTAGGRTFDLEVMTRLRTLSMAAVEAPSMETIRRRLEWLFHDPAQIPEDLVEMRYRIYRQPGFAKAMESIMCLQLPEVRRRNMRADAMLQQIAAETLVVWTDHDPTGAVEVGQAFADLIPNARLEIMSDCGHWPQFEDPQTFNALQLDFFAP